MNIDIDIKELRLKSRMTQQRFSDYFKIPIRTIQSWETKERKCNEYLIDLIEYKLKKEGII